VDASAAKGRAVRDLLDEFKAFVLRGNVVDLAVAVILGIAFGTVVTSFTDDVLMAIIGAIVGEPNFDELTFDIGDGVVRYGEFLTAVVNFLLIALSLFFIIRMLNQFIRHRRESEPSDEVRLLTEIRDELRARR
jgi:large conductance mechanosensitive channel